MRTTSEYERKLEAPIGFRLPRLGGSPLEPRLFTSVYYDVPGGWLAASGITLRRRIENGRGVWQLKLPSADSRLELEAQGGPEQPPAQLLNLLRAHLRHGPPERVAELRTRRRGENGHGSDRFVEVEIELCDGNPAYLDLVAEELESAGAGAGTEMPKVFRALGRRSHDTSSEATPFEELRSRLGVQLQEIERHDPGARLGRDPESVHDMRVGVRRFRALLRAGKELVETDTAELDEQLKQLGRVLGDVRDLDVLLARLEADASELGGADAKRAQVLLASLRTERSGCRSRLLGALRSEQYLALLDDAARTIEELEPSRSRASLDALADAAFAKVRKAVHKLPEDPADEQLHSVRKKGKRARYAAELAGWKTSVRRAKRLQDVLGEHQDAVVAAGRLRELAAAATPEQALAAGRLVEREEERRLEARAAWPKAWKKLRREI
jgi:CHAD domain-containing protein